MTQRTDLNEQGVPLIRCVYCDNGGVIRGKSIPASDLAVRLRSGVGATVAMQAVTPMDHLVDIPTLGVVGEFRLVPDPATFTSLPHVFEAIVLCDMLDLEHQPWGACPRDFLKRMQARLQAHGMQARLGTEHEFHLIRREEGNTMAADNAALFGTEALDIHARFVRESVQALQEAGIAPTLVHAEYGPGQMEISLAIAEALAAADHVCLLREMLRGVARNNGMLASFAPKPFLDEKQMGNGMHLHVSLWDGKQSNVFYDEHEPEKLSTLGRQFIGGVLAHLPALVALTCGSVNSHQRLTPHAWSSAYGCWGFDNREAALRVPSLYWEQEQESLNIELRCSDHSGNPYLAIAGLLAAGLDGIERQLDPGASCDCDPATLSEEEREHASIRRLPQTLDEALDALEADALFVEAMGPLLASSYLGVKRAEVAFFADKSPQEIAQAHLLTY